MDNIKARDLFENAFSKIKNSIDFNREWSDGQGGLDLLSVIPIFKSFCLVRL